MAEMDPEMETHQVQSQALWLPRGQQGDGGGQDFMSAIAKLKLLIEYKLQSRHRAKPDELSFNSVCDSNGMLQDGVGGQFDCRASSWFTVT